MVFNSLHMLDGKIWSLRYTPRADTPQSLIFVILSRPLIQSVPEELKGQADNNVTILSSRLLSCSLQEMYELLHLLSILHIHGYIGCICIHLTTGMALYP